MRDEPPAWNSNLMGDEHPRMALSQRLRVHQPRRQQAGNVAMTVCAHHASTSPLMWRSVMPST